MNEADEVLEQAERVLDERGWVSGLLTGDDGSHCALGAIGFATMGAEFDRVAVANRTNVVTADGKNAYEMIAQNPKARAAMFALAERVAEFENRTGRFVANPVPEDHYTKPHSQRDLVDTQANAAMSIIMGYNDRSPNRGTRVFEAFRSTWTSLRVRRAAKKAAKRPVDHPLEREIVVPPISAAQQVQTVKEVK